ncbi:hypothetical protein EJP617_28890 [Erwinia sp. Ejp617]|nr:hypothetical protein EJP617_28890 [Erwinia sp. Ejp617]
MGGLLIGTMFGVSLFRGVPVGPLIADGLLSLMLGKGERTVVFCPPDFPATEKSCEQQTG